MSAGIHVAKCMKGSFLAYICRQVSCESGLTGRQYRSEHLMSIYGRYLFLYTKAKHTFAN